MENHLLKRIVETSKIDMNDPEIQIELEIDLERMDRLTHQDRPEGTDSFLITVTPSETLYKRGHHRFLFEIQYGTQTEQGFTPIGEPKHYNTQSLPFLN